MCMYVTGTARFPQQLHVFITFDLYCVHNNIDRVQPEHKQWCMNCMQVLLYHHHRPHQVRTTPSFPLAIPCICNQYEQPVSNKKCMCPMKSACFQYDMHVSNRHWTDARINACTNVHVRNRHCTFSTAAACFHYIRFVLRAQ